MKVNEITIKIRPSSSIREYNAVDIVVDTSSGRRERRELIPSNDILSKMDSMYEMIKEELKFFMEEEIE